MARTGCCGAAAGACSSWRRPACSATTTARNGVSATTGCRRRPKALLPGRFGERQKLVEHVIGSLRLGVEVMQVLGRCDAGQALPLNDLDPGEVQCLDLVGVVGQQNDAAI